MSDPDEIVEMFLKFPNALSHSQKSDYERCAAVRLSCSCGVPRPACPAQR
jgi:hypothetical protein